MEVFLKNGWPEHQHGYTTGRGVHTAWAHILSVVIKSKNIFEFDFIGFFNNVNLNSVAENLKRCSEPKWVSIHFINLVSSDVENISPKNLEKKLESKTWILM